MTEPSETIEHCRRILRGAGERLVSHGIEPIDVALATAYATHDALLHVGLDPHAAVEWMRTAADLQERQLMEAGR